ncbi:CRISPR-associated protein Cmr2 [Solimonas aquatica]|uniref:CRISPR-associated protein Cmr2 n=1 Tax=Solimonas aquatica TaxID=489703 RepID=A0A1H9M9J6_9GAMM|nr:type III-B CRISPR-associated protein Cas10/Cmr2 [Solimonas aquatica]SER20127.1 CRISPR-associated protein Cmr2 [Solimonas aquatica]
MDELAFWQQKLIQFFHDPPAKPFSGNPKAGTQKKVAVALFDAFQQANKERKLRYWYKSADWAAAGADRPMLYTPRGTSGLGTLTWHNYPEITHPLSPGCRLAIDIEAGLSEAEDGPENDDEAPDPRLVPLQEQIDAAMKLAGLAGDWRDPAQLKQVFFALWRRYRDDLVAARRGEGRSQFGNPLWEEMPAETRCPDHSIWDHLKVVTALAFMKPHKFKEPPRDEGAQEPWMLRFAIGPIQSFIEQSRTSRDLWTSSVLLADLAWHAMQPLVEHYGPDCIVYPDLRANPRADCWLFEQHRDALGDVNPITFAAVLPGSFVALLPRGGAQHLETIEELAQTAQKSVDQRWQTLAGTVLNWFRQTDQWDSHCDAIWSRQHAHSPVRCTWVAVPWRHMGHIENVDHLRGQALPAQHRPAPADPQQAQRDQATLDQRRQRLAPWLPPQSWAHYELAREVYARSHLDYHQMERGFDYALTHHQLGLRHALRKASNTAPAPAAEPGEKCTLCGQREALHGVNGAASLDYMRQSTREFWQDKKLDPDQTGAERLCAVCALKRFLVKADQGPGDQLVFNRLWVGIDVAEIVDRDGKLRVPFPSTATIAAQQFLAELFEKVLKDSSLQAPIVRVLGVAGRHLPRTSFPRALPRLATRYRNADPSIRDLLEYEAEDLLFPEVADGKAQGLRARGEAKEAGRAGELKDAVVALRDAANKAGIKPPGKRIAVIRLDGDRIGKLLLGEPGDPGAIATRWRDVLHPTVLERLLENQHLLDAGWAGLLDSKRLMGPCLHAFVSRAMGHFGHRIVPWVVEQEFSGRLIYSGGDDVLCIAPANEALALAARLQQLFSAAWVVDTVPPENRDQWAWRRRDWKGDYDHDQARQRFAIPLPVDGKGAPEPIRLCEPGQRIALHAADDKWRPTDELPRRAIDGTLLPMLGSSATLSAGIAIGHYKTPLSVLLRRSKDLLTFAKDTGRCSVGIGHASRGGNKSRFAMPWERDAALGRPVAHLSLNTVIEAFRNGELPGRLPYKLRELAPSARYGLERIQTLQHAEQIDTARTNLLRGLFASCIDLPKTPGAQAAFQVWERGVSLYEQPQAARPEAVAARDGERREERYTDGLLLCRELARGGDSGEDEE